MGRTLLANLGILLLLPAAAYSQDSAPPASPASPSASSDASDDDGAPWNLDSPTFGGKQFWTDELVFHEWRIQRHAVTGHCRLLDDHNVRRAWGAFDACFRELQQSKRNNRLPPLKPRVILVLHGLVRSRESMDGLCRHLQTEPEFSVLNVSYASTRKTIAEHAAALARVVENLGEGVSEVNFVGHSLGNLVIRYYLGESARNVPAGFRSPRLGRMVMLGPPNHGAEMAQRFQENAIFLAVWGASGKELANDWARVDERLAIPACSFGIIAGGTGKADGRNPLIAGDDDFIVSVDETRLPGAADFLVLPVLHGTMMSDHKVQECTLRFLLSGYFVSPTVRQPIPASPHD